MSNMAPRMLKKIMQPAFTATFYQRYDDCSGGSRDSRFDLNILKNVLEMYRKLADNQNLGDLGTQALIKYYED